MLHRDELSEPPSHHARPLVHPQVQEMRENLNEDWVWFQRVLIDSESMLQENKEKFKSSLIRSSQEFKEKIQAALEEFNKTGHTHCRFLTHTHIHMTTSLCRAGPNPDDLIDWVMSLTRPHTLTLLFITSLHFPLL